ncbi:hypothetical protein Q5P01_002153 [Channa striata]|uniref:Uncharacterized protein n=1 Tax=Channa striata TaxID=64152 RepID=A0AA88NQK4_CHASR|nr:hypothetical protein Q5P01_002153 [Channa striata]
MSELLTFRDSCRETDPRLLPFNFQELYEKIFFRNWTNRNDTTEIKAEVKKALETLFSGMTSGNEEIVEEQSTATEADLSVSKVSVATVSPTDLKQTTPPKVKTGRVHSMQETAGTGKTAKTDNKPCPASCQPRPTPPALKTRPAEKMVPSPSSVVTGNVKPLTSKIGPPPQSSVSTKPPISQKNMSAAPKSKTDLPVQRVASKPTPRKETENTRPQPPTSKDRKESAGATGDTLKMDTKPCPSPSHPRQTPPPRKITATNKTVPSPSHIVAGHVKLSTSKGVSTPQSSVSSKSPIRLNPTAPVLPKTPVLPSILQENRAIPPPQPPISKDKEPEKTKVKSITARIPRQDSIKTMAKILKDRKPDSTRTQLPPNKEEEPELNRTPMTSTCAATSEVTGLEVTRTQTQTKTKTGCKDKPESALAKVYKGVVSKPETGTHLNKPKPEWTFEHPRSSKAPWSGRPVLWWKMPGQGSDRPCARPAVNKGKSYSVSFGAQMYGSQDPNTLDMTQYTYTYHTCPHLAQPVHVISRIRLQAQPIPGHSGLSATTAHN